MYDHSILPTEIAVLLGLICNIGAPLLAFWSAGKLPRLRLWFHGLAFAAILVSPLMAMALGLPGLLPEDEDGPEVRFAFLPLIVEAAIILLLYCLAAAMLFSKSVQTAIADWHEGDRFQRMNARPRPGSSRRNPVSRMPRSR